jgi:hypothetical protein
MIRRRPRPVRAGDTAARPAVSNRPALDPDAYAEIRAKILARDHWRCQNPWCGRPKQLTVAHLVSRGRTGPDRPENLITLCAACHRATEDGRLGMRLTGSQGGRPTIDWQDHRPRTGAAW